MCNSHDPPNTFHARINKIVIHSIPYIDKKFDLGDFGAVLMKINQPLYRLKPCFQMFFSVYCSENARLEGGTFLEHIDRRRFLWARLTFGISRAVVKKSSLRAMGGNLPVINTFLRQTLCLNNPRLRLHFHGRFYWTMGI